MTDEARKNAYLYCKFRDEQFAMYDEYAKRHGMLMKTLLVVNALYYAQDGLTQRDVCAKTLQSKQTVNQIIRNLLDAAHVTLEEKRENRREKLVRMTAAGRNFYGSAVRHITRAEDTAMAMLSQTEQRQLIDMSRRFTQNLAQLIHQETEDTQSGLL